MSENKPDLTAELAAYKRLCSTPGIDASFKYQAAANFMNAHHAELEAAVRKAARYDWLRDRLAGADHVRELVGYNHDMYPKLREEVDSEIDQAMHNSAREG